MCESKAGKGHFPLQAEYIGFSTLEKFAQHVNWRGAHTTKQRAWEGWQSEYFGMTW